MQNRHANSAESFQLLQLSDDSKSLSDLALPEILPQRKRKVRRKVRSRSHHRYNQPTDETVKLNCKYVSIWMCVTVSCAWLFLLSYILGIVHSECHELTTRIDKLSAICLSMPDALQKLHESSKFQEQNQTAISQKIYEIQQRIENFEKEILQLKENIRKKDESPGSDKAVDLKDTVAGFGANIQALESDVNTLKERNAAMQQLQDSEKLRLDQLRSTVNNFANLTQLNLTTGTQNESSLWIKNFTDQCSTDLKNVSNQLAAINDTFSQKIKTMDDELHDHQTHLDGLKENLANVSSHVMSIEAEWPKFKQANQNYDMSIGLMSKDILSLKSNVLNLTTAIRNIQTNPLNSHITDSVPTSNKNIQNQTNGSQSNANESRVTKFPDELLNPIQTSNTTGVTSQPPQNKTVSQSKASSTTIPVPMK